ncbi:MAG: division/cell wall cluster transcriptional repressor MraZ [Gammaproteobacteria bacterium]
MFRGINSLTLDVKGRMAVPAKYRERLIAESNSQLIVTIDPDPEDHCLWLYPLPVWEAIEHTLDSLPSLDKAAQKIRRILIGHATECELDGQGRLLLPSPLRAMANLDREVALVGQGKKFEIWNEVTWIAHRDKWMAEDIKDYTELSDDLKNLSL